MAEKQYELDRFSSKGKQLVIELKKVPECDSEMMKKDMETLVDQWLDVSLTGVLRYSHNVMISHCCFEQQRKTQE